MLTGTAYPTSTLYSCVPGQLVTVREAKSQTKHVDLASIVINRCAWSRSQCCSVLSQTLRIVGIAKRDVQILGKYASQQFDAVVDSILSASAKQITVKIPSPSSALSKINQ